jgi:two-component system, chemotaxis family, protein-glutamate methylesterase/glutaminase
MTTTVNTLFRSPFEIVAIGASLGGLPALRKILSLLPADFPVPIVVVQHRAEKARATTLPECLNSHSNLFVENAQEGTPLEPGAVYLAPPGKHLIVDEQQRTRLIGGNRMSYSRPSVNTLFYSVAKVYEARAIGVVLTGLNSDGAHGCVALKVTGSFIMAQDPLTCQAPQMPRAAIGTGCVDIVLSLEGIANALTTLVMVRGAVDHFPAKDFLMVSSA